MAGRVSWVKEVKEVLKDIEKLPEKERETVLRRLVVRLAEKADLTEARLESAENWEEIREKQRVAEFRVHGIRVAVWRDQGPLYTEEPGIFVLAHTNWDERRGCAVTKAVSVVVVPPGGEPLRITVHIPPRLQHLKLVDFITV